LKIEVNLPILKQISETAAETGMDAFVIGGFVRDHILYRPCNDIDIVVSDIYIDELIENLKLIIENLELFDRGLYSGALGWIDFNNNADIAVGIRSALLKGNQLRAFAGCGIVEGSEALSEYKETELKFQPILSLFENENID